MRPRRFFDDIETIQRATERLTRRCMNQKGLRYDGQAQLVDRYQGGLPPDLDFRRSKGFGLTESVRPVWEPSEQDANAWYLAARGPAEYAGRWRTIAGSGEMAAGGCIGKAQTRVAGSVLEWFWAVHAQQDYWLVVSRAIPADPRWADAVQRWSECMAKRGHPGLDSPMRPWILARTEIYRQHAASGRVPPETSAREIDLAVDDGTCTISSGMADVDRSIRQAFLAGAAPEYRRDLRRIARAQTKALQTIDREELDP